MKYLIPIILLLLNVGLSAQQNWSKSDANYVIDYQNRVTSYLNKHSDDIQYFDERVLNEAYKKYIENKLNTYIQSRIFTYDNKSHTFDKQIFSPPAQFNQNDRNFYTLQVNKLDSVLFAFSTIANEYFYYEKERKFETDNGEKGKTYTQNLIHLSKRFYTLRKTIFQKFDEVEDQLFEISIEGSPKAKYLIPMNNCLKKARNLSDLLYDVENYNMNKDQINAIKTDLVNKYLAFDEKRDYYKTHLAHEYADFERFYIRTNKFCENADEFIAKLIENPYLLEEYDYESISRHYNYMVENYNYFIN